MDKREYPRFDKDLQIEYALQQKNYFPDTRGRILNISLGGVYMLSGSLIEKDTSITLTFTIQKDGRVSTLSTEGSVLRSGNVSDEPEMMAKYNIETPEGPCFAVVKFETPVIELSFMLH